MKTANIFPPIFIRSILCLILLLLGLGMPISSTNVIASPLCNGHSCDGLNPQTMGCGSDAVTGTYKIFSIGRAEHRISSACDAKWERTRLLSGSPKYAAGSLRFGCQNYCYDQSIRSPAKIAVGEQIYTPMEGDSSIPTRACGEFSDTGPITIPVPVLDGLCSTVD